MDVRSLMRRSAQFHAAHTAVIAGEQRLTFDEAWGRGLRVANGLLSLGLQPGDRVGVLEDNTVEAADLFVGAAAANLVRVPLYPRNSRAAHGHMLGHTGCRALVVAERYADDVAGLVDELPSLEHVLVRDAGYESWLAAQAEVEPDVAADPDDPFIIRHTGGTTGLSKGVAYTHRAWLASGRDWFYAFPPVQVGDVCMHLGPISHGSGYFFTPMWLSGGANLLLGQFDPETALDAMERERVAYMFLVPTMLNMLCRHPSAAGRDWSALKVVQVGGSPITDDTALTAREVFGDVLYQGYGQTEALPICMMGPTEWFSDVPGSEPLRAAGRALPYADLAIWDTDAGTPLPLGEEGEIVVRCDGQMLGFWEDPEATAQRLVDGWVLTGDIGRIDANGYLYVLDRKDDMIISGGYNIWPAELENVLTDHPDVVEAAAFGIPDDRWGETPMAVCTVVEGASVTADALIELCRERLGSYKKPARVELTAEPLPKSPVGKLQRRQLREPHWRDHDRRVGGA